MGLIGIKYPSNSPVCVTDEHWYGRNLLRDAFKDAIGTPRQYHGENTPDGRKVYDLISTKRPLYWSLESPYTRNRQYFPAKIAIRDANYVAEFLKANGLNVTTEQEAIGDSIVKTPWDDQDLIRVYGTGSHSDPYASDTATLAALPHMRARIWNTVRSSTEKFIY